MIQPLTPWEGAQRPPRAWQAEALPVVMDAIRRDERGVVCVATGGGKSVLQAELVRLALPKTVALGRTIVVVAPRQALVEQLSATIEARCGRGMVGRFYAKKRDDAPVLVACGASLERLHLELALLKRKVSLMIVDECHSSESPTLRAVIPAMAPARLVGFTATAFRSDESQSLGLFDRLLYRYTYNDALRDGVLVPYVVMNWDGTGNPTCDDACVQMIRDYGRGPGIVSAQSIADAENFAVYLSERGLPALAIHSLQSQDERDRLLELLRVGKLRALVHVSLLAEGVDLPWLRWVCLRRPVGARVRFIQELGRVLRVCSPYETWSDEDTRLWGAKRHAVILDPHDLLGKLGLSHAERLGEVEREEEERAARKGSKAELARKIVELPAPVAVSAAAAWAQRLLLQMEGEGLARVYVAAPSKRAGASSSVQRELLDKVAWFTRYLPEQVRPVVKALVARPEQMTWGEVSDLISILQGVAHASKDARDARRHWRWPSQVEAEELDEVVVGKLAAEEKSRIKQKKSAEKARGE